LNKAYLMLGSNIHPELNIPRALGLLNKSFTVCRVSHTWRTQSVGRQADDFFNTAVEIETGLTEILLKEKCLCHIEEIMGRVRENDKNAPRTIDIDIVVFNHSVLEPEIFTREHLAVPLAELLPDLAAPDQSEPLKRIAAALHEHGSAIDVGMISPVE